MPIKYDELMALKKLGQKYAYSDREVMLYAYGIGTGAGLSPLRRPQSVAQRSGVCKTRRLSKTDPARDVHLRHHLPRHFADLCRLRSLRLQTTCRAIFLTGLSGRDRRDGFVEGRQCDFVRGKSEGA